MFPHETKQVLRTFLLLRPCSPENSNKGLFMFCNSVQVFSSMHSNMQLFYLLLFFAVGVGIAVLVA